jgi:glycosyltransferase involved in cell wall biosynthesis
VFVLHTQRGKRQFPSLRQVTEIEIDPRPGRRQYMLECLELSERFLDALVGLPDAVVYSQGICVVRGIRRIARRLIVNPHGLEAFQVTGLRDQLHAIPMRAIHRHMFRHALRVVSLGGRLTDILARECGGPERVAVLPNGVVVPGGPPRPRSEDRGTVRVLFVGRLAPNKGVPDLLAAVEELDRRGVAEAFRVDIVGGGPLLDRLRFANRRSNVQFRGKVGDSDLEELYASADVLVLPTLFEGMPTVVLEAMARGLPVLVTDVGASKELVDSTNGEIIPKRDPGSLADALERMRDLGPSGRKVLGDAGLRRVRTRFEWDHVADGHARLFEEVASLAFR